MAGSHDDANSAEVVGIVEHRRSPKPTLKSRVPGLPMSLGRQSLHGQWCPLERGAGAGGVQKCQNFLFKHNN